MASSYYLRADTTQLRALIARTTGPFGSPPVANALGQAIRKWGALVQARAVRNVSGYPVVYAGGVFRVMVRTGTLKGAIELQWPYETNYQARVFVNGTHTNPGASPGEGGTARPQPVSAYAAAIEEGHGPIDLKKTMKGKTVPFFASRGGKTRGPYTARGLEPVDVNSQDFGSRWRSGEHDRKLAAKGKGPMTFHKRGGGSAFRGKGSTSYFISFRKVGDTGWVIPAAKPRPFMRAAMEATTDQGRRMVVADVARALESGA